MASFSNRSKTSAEFMDIKQFKCLLCDNVLPSLVVVTYTASLPSMTTFLNGVTSIFIGIIKMPSQGTSLSIAAQIYQGKMRLAR